MNQRDFIDLKELISNEKRIIKRMFSLSEDLDKVESMEERKIIISSILSLKNPLQKNAENILGRLEKTIIVKPLPSDIPKKEGIEEKQFTKPSLRTKVLIKKIELTKLEKDTLNRLKKRRGEIIYKKKIKPNPYVEIATRIFSKTAKKLIKKEFFKGFERDLVKANMQFIPINYVSVILFTTLISLIVSFFVFLFFLFFSISFEDPFIIAVSENIIMRLLETFWILFVIPIATFFIMYFYPSLEKSGIERNINREIPFATIHMSSIAGSMINPSKIFNIIVETKEYPHIEKEFIKLINEINIYGYDLVTALKNMSFNCPSTKLAELYNGLAATINSGGDLPGFFEERSKSLLFEYRLEREKLTKSSETFMDIYISVVVAAPMIFMLLLMMMKISGLGLSLSISMISLIMVLGVSMINVIFLVFLQIKQPGE